LRGVWGPKGVGVQRNSALELAHITLIPIATVQHHHVLLLLLPLRRPRTAHRQRSCRLLGTEVCRVRVRRRCWGGSVPVLQSPVTVEGRNLLAVICAAPLTRERPRIMASRHRGARTFAKFCLANPVPPPRCPLPTHLSSHSPPPETPLLQSFQGAQDHRQRSVAAHGRKAHRKGAALACAWRCAVSRR